MRVGKPTIINAAIESEYSFTCAEAMSVFDRKKTDLRFLRFSFVHKSRIQNMKHADFELIFSPIIAFKELRKFRKSERTNSLFSREKKLKERLIFDIYSKNPVFFALKSPKSTFSPLVSAYKNISLHNMTVYNKNAVLKF